MVDFLCTVNLAHSVRPSLPKGLEDGAKDVNVPLKYITDKEQKVLGIKHRTQEETTRDLLDDFERRGWF
jgi:hypothetical protein